MQGMITTMVLSALFAPVIFGAIVGLVRALREHKEAILGIVIWIVFMMLYFNYVILH